jgi:hypothetical protein
MLRHKASTAFLLGLLILGVSLPAAAQWKWRDAQGKIQYSDLPPPGSVKDKDILARPANAPLRVVVIPAPGTEPVPVPAKPPAPPPSPAASAPSKAELEQAAKQKAETQRLAEMRRENCSRAQDALKMLESGVRIRSQAANGESYVMSDEQRAEEINRTRAIAANECK